MDNSRAHYNSEIQKLFDDMRVDIQLLPPNTTSKL